MKNSKEEVFFAVERAMKNKKHPLHTGERMKRMLYLGVYQLFSEPANSIR